MNCRKRCFLHELNFIAKIHCGKNYKNVFSLFLAVLIEAINILLNLLHFKKEF